MPSMCHSCGSHKGRANQQALHERLQSVNKGICRWGGRGGGVASFYNTKPGILPASLHADLIPCYRLEKKKIIIKIKETKYTKKYI